MQIRLLLLLFCASLSPLLPAQVRLNEAVSSNSVYLDEDGDSPDWFELYNPGTESVDISGYTLSDKANNPGKWTIPVGLQLGPDQHAFFWASNKDRSVVNTYRTFITRGDDFRYLIPTGAVSNTWINTSFDDTSWAEGPAESAIMMAMMPLLLPMARNLFSCADASK